ncbi:hypothetical protein Tco_1418934 [Tanacetum coccineum]
MSITGVLDRSWRSPTDWSRINLRNNGKDHPDQAKDASCSGSTKSLADQKQKPMEFKVGDRVMLKVSPWKGVVDTEIKTIERSREYHLVRFDGTLGEVLSLPGNVKIRSNKNTHSFSQTGICHPLQGLKL